MSQLVLTHQQKIYRLANGRLLIKNSLIHELRRFQLHWPHHLRVILQPTKIHPTSSEEYCELEQSQLPFELLIIDYSSSEFRDYISKFSIVLLIDSKETVDIAKFCIKNHIPFFWISDHPFLVRLQLSALEEKNTFSFAVRFAKEASLEQKYRQIARKAIGIQCHGTPSYYHYHKINDNTITYYLNPEPEPQLISKAELTTRLNISKDTQNRLRMIIACDLYKKNGTQYILELARLLQNYKILYKICILGEGPEKGKIQTSLTDNHLGQDVEFKSQIKTKDWYQFDLSICLQLQSEPNPNYIRALSCGIPLVGFANDAIVGLCKGSQAGKIVPLWKIKSIAKAISEFDKNRELLIQASQNARELSRKYTLDKMLSKRIQHIQNSLGSVLKVERLQS